ncbi:bestrophin family protein [Phaeocystidibacter luteus]|uniref:Multidrug transporter n=1 Tax=Phaeocystidibacter luteus TaxID=911197 RepID=A0A6N6RL83_9FLAO|nr:bestrophin family ion channel [Phaeocystidibacter luteus]KAB2813961.1 multidrug transporter [Phaeocystidibacter luteus]
MHAGSHFKLLEALIWTRRDLYKFALIASIATVAYEVLDFKWISIPWIPVTLIGTAVAFLIGFKNNATYDRLWEARKIWGAIVNASRTWGVTARDFVTNDFGNSDLTKEEIHSIHKRLIYRHIAWLAALRHQLRQTKPWENMNQRRNEEYRRRFSVREHDVSLESEMIDLLSDSDLKYVLAKKNRATHILSLQSADLKHLRSKDLIDDFRHVKLQGMIEEFYTEQGKCERIKNFPYPRQFATLNRYFVWLFLLLLPLGMIAEFEKLGNILIWMNIPFSMLVSWVFYTMDKIGEVSENPFQGGANDIPITNLSRTIEIDLREMLDESDIPAPTEAENQILM